ncbi:12684_t:CDS:1, partial [Entrophospora sp. SA101]
QISPWELGYLGTLPTINPECIELAIKLALALQAKISPLIIFDRKIYHYYDLPKGYQITQYRQPLANSGYLPLITPSGIINIPLRNLQLEEDTAKSFYTQESIELDFNRAGNPLIELVTEPVFHNSEETILFLRQLQNLLRYLDISEAKMEKGQLRVDLNFSLNLADNYQTPRYEVKNLNSFNAIERVLKYEIDKHQQL